MPLVRLRATNSYGMAMHKNAALAAHHNTGEAILNRSSKTGINAATATMKQISSMT